jgi:hypothetical protein
MEAPPGPLVLTTNRSATTELKIISEQFAYNQLVSRFARGFVSLFGQSLRLSELVSLAWLLRYNQCAQKIVEAPE